MNVLVLTHRLPFPPNRGDRVRAYHIIRHLAASGARVHVVSLVHDAEEAAGANGLRRLGVEVSVARTGRLRNLARGAAMLSSDTPLTHALLDAPDLRLTIARAVRDSAPDVVLAYCSGIARFALEPPLDRLPFVLDFVDIDSAKWAAFAETASWPRRWLYRREARHLATFEAMAAARAFATTIVNAREREALGRLCGSTHACVVPNGVDVEHLTPRERPAAEPRVIFTAVFNYAPNVEGALWMAREVWPRVVAAVPGARLTLAGASPTRAVRGLAALHPSIDVTGSVPDMRPHLWASAIAVAPVFQARGVQNKVLEAAAAGLPSVVTRAVAQGLPDEVLPACRVADDAADFAREVIALLSLAPEERRELAALAHLSALGWPHRIAPMAALLEAAAESRRPKRAHRPADRITRLVAR